MSRCPTCSAEVPEGNRYCGTCGSLHVPSSKVPTLDFAVAETSLGVLSSPVQSSRSTPIPIAVPAAAPGEGRFPPGTIIAQRYRVSGLLGRGGMGEVYKVTDLLIGQVVALKLLPEMLSSNIRMLERLRNEVRIARQVTHPNVCRVHDLGETEGQLYLTMEYVDGEDLQSLLRRIGSLPVPKALEIARYLCRGLAAAHDKGVLHRDLKPGNILIDGRGNVLITDFGLAAVAGQLDPADVRNGTPAYMAPEQLTGLEVTGRSDIFALGLVLYEILAGRQPYVADRWDELLRLQEASDPPPLSNFVKDLDPVVEAIIRQCLAPRPADRPTTPLAVAVALPGGDPLAAALAAGETPSPETVAAAGESRGISRALAAACLATLIAGLLAMAWVTGKVSQLARLATDLSPEVLVQKSREMLEAFGYPSHPASTAWGLDYNLPFLQGLESLESRKALARIAAARPPGVYFWFRGSPRPIEPLTASWFSANETDPPQVLAGMSWLRLDLRGRLLGFAAVPPAEDTGALSPTVDWRVLFQTAGLDPGRFAPVTPRWTPAVPFDARAAWLETSAATDALRLEAAAWHGRVAWFRLDPDNQTVSAETVEQNLGMANSVALPVALLIAVGGIVLAWRNIRSSRGDVHGAALLGIFVSVCGLLAWICAAPHFLSIREVSRFMITFALASGLGLCTAIQYIALEPYVRAGWPHALISWSRLLAGSFRDPLVGRHVLAGLMGGVALALLYRLHGAIYSPASADTRSALLELALGGRRLPGGIFYAAVDGLFRGFTVLLMLFLLSRILRSRIAAAVVVGAFFGASYSAASAQPWLTGGFFLVTFSLVAWFTLRLGLLALAALMWTGVILSAYPMTLDTSSWYFGATLFPLVVLGGAGVWAVRVACSAQTGVPPPTSRVTY